MPIHILDEANRCLQCKNPQCVKGCPIHTDIPGMIKHFRDNSINQAGKELFKNNPLSVICSLVCAHERQCEGHCVLGKKGTPVHISSIENYISDSCLDKMDTIRCPSNGKSAAVIGAGPAGMTIAFSLAELGYGITLFDAREKIGGMLQYGVPEFRLPKTLLERYRQKLLQMDVKIRPNTTIGGALDINDLFRDNYKSVFIGTGVWRPKKLGIEGESLGNVHFAIDYLASPSHFELGSRVAVIGMGNSAMDVARTALRRGTREVTVFGRSAHTSSNEEEAIYAKLDGAKFLFNQQIVKILPDGPVFRTIIRDDSGNIIRVENDDHLYPADSVIISVSQGPKNKLILTTEGLLANEKGLLITDEDGHTTVPGVFAAGDVVLGARSAVEAVANAKRVANAMHHYMMEK